MNVRVKDCPFCGGGVLSIIDVSYSTVIDGKAIKCGQCGQCGQCGVITVLGKRELGEERALARQNARDDLPVPALPPRLKPAAMPPDRLASVMFCLCCLASEEIRKQASWVGKRYCPCEEDYERDKEVETLYCLMTEYPGRSVECCFDDETGVYFNVSQKTPGGCETWTTYSARQCGSADEALAHARKTMPYFTQELYAFRFMKVTVYDNSAIDQVMPMKKENT